MPSFCDDAENFAVLPHQWIVERRLGWFMQNCRLSKDYERLCASSEARWYKLP
jgi:transposase